MITVFSPQRNNLYLHQYITEIIKEDITSCHGAFDKNELCTRCKNHLDKLQYSDQMQNIYRMVGA